MGLEWEGELNDKLPWLFPVKGQSVILYSQGRIQVLNYGGWGYRTLLDAPLPSGRENHREHETLIYFWEIQGFLGEETHLCIA